MSQGNDQNMDDSLPSPSSAFRPRNPGVIRTPPGETAENRRAQQAIVEDEEMEDVQPTAGTSAQVSQIVSESQVAGSSRTPPRDQDAAMSQAPKTPSQAAAGPSTHTPRSKRKTPAEVNRILNTPVARMEGNDESEVSFETDTDHGKRWKATLGALEAAAKAASQKWSAKDLKQCFPLIAAQAGGDMDAVWLSASQTMKANLMNSAMSIMEHYRVPISLQRIDEVVKEAKDYARVHKMDSVVRPDAWRPDTTPRILHAATNLPIYDEAYERLRVEYLELHEDCRTRYASLLAKQTMLADLENGVAEGVEELEKTIQLMDGFPNEEMMTWMETVGGTRDQ